ncbi:Ecdysone-induced protein 78C like protein [Argiope bruennichi]|uniref:Ecdysone-induced protein 78C like protein n=1 Tax=Argiope bruennichi TaxID=94029 RepID=A0A8T0G0U1_ARGBR|nr:Ecdysone-induced protein 78C like protein [Argiope bruennichi]
MYDMIVSITQAHLAHCAYTQAKTQGLLRKPVVFSGINGQQSVGVPEGGGWHQFSATVGVFKGGGLGKVFLSFTPSIPPSGGISPTDPPSREIHQREFVTMVFNFVCWINNLHLSDYVIGLYAAAVLVSAERDGLYDHKALQPLQEQILEALRQKVTEEHSSEPHIFPALVAKLQDLHLLGRNHLEHLRWFRTNWMHLRLSPLFAEVFDIPQHDVAQR